MEMDIPPPAAPPVQETGEVDEVESPAFDGMDFSSFDADQIQQLLQIAQMQLDTKAAASQLCG